jgi:hypothetical protein
MTTTYHSLAGGNFTQDWSDTSLISTNDDWSGVPSIVGYLGDFTSSTSSPQDPRTFLDDAGATVDVNANQTNPNTFTFGGVAEFEIADPTIALNGSGTADAPYIVIHLDTTGVTDVNLAFDVRDLDGSVDNAAQQLNVQYRVGETGNWTNLDGGYFADLTEGPSLATLVTPISLLLPDAVEGQAQVQVRIMTGNSVGNDEWIGIDNIVVSSGEPPPAEETVSIAATDANKPEGDAGTTAFTFTVTRANPDGDASVDWSVQFGSATADDFAGLLEGTVTFLGDDTEETITIEVAGDTLFEGNETFSVVLSNPSTGTVIGTATASGTIQNDDPQPLTAIYDIQGAAQRSPLLGQSVLTTGIVTAKTSNGFWMQDPTGDGDDATSDGIFVFTDSAPDAVSVGDAVQVAGTVSEFTPSGSVINNSSITQISGGPVITVLSSGNALPDAVIIGTGGRLPPTEIINTPDDPNTPVNEGISYDPTTDGIDFWESLEGMRVTLPDAQAVGPSFTNTTFNDSEVFAVGNQGANATGRNAAGGLTLSEFDQNPEKIAIQEDNRVFDNNFSAKTGDLLGDVTGIISYDGRGNYEIIVTEAFTVTAIPPEEGGLVKEGASALNGGVRQLLVGTYNVENLSAEQTSDAKFTQLGIDIADLMNAPDIVALQEIQDNNGTVNNGNVDASQTYAELIAAIIAAGGPTYEIINIDPVNNTSGGAPGANIRVGFLYRTDRVDLVDGSVRQVDPTNTAWTDSRISLAADFLFNGEVVTVVNNHWSSKGGSGALYGTVQPPVNGGEDDRIDQATVIKDFVDGLLAADADANIVVLGDLNEFAWEEPLEIVTGVAEGQRVLFDLHELTESDPNEVYEYVFDGSHQVLDHILASAALLEDARFDALHINAQFPASERSSDHDPALALFTLGESAAIELGFVLDGVDATNLLYTNATIAGQQSSDSLVDSTGLSLSRFRESGGNVAIEQVDFAGEPVGTGETAVTSLTWDGDNASVVNLAGWGVLPVLDIIDFTGGALTLSGFQTVGIALDRAVDEQITLDGVQTGSVSTGAGNDVLTVGLDGTDPIDQEFVVSTGEGDDAVLVQPSQTDVAPDGLWRIGDVVLTVDLGGGNDSFKGSGAREFVFGGEGNDRIQTDGGDDFVSGGADDDVLKTGKGNDLLSGGSGNDVLNAGSGNDTMFGGADADRFVFTDARGFTDVIEDFDRDEGDRIVLTKIDAIAGTVEDDAFSFIGDAAFSMVAGELRYTLDGSTSIIEGDVDGDGVGDFFIIAAGAGAAQGNWFAL